MTNLTGKTLSERYRIEQSLGQGGMAEVYKAWDIQRATYLALKVLRQDLARDQIFLRRFQREAQTLAKLQHPNIVRFYGIEVDQLIVFMLMDFIEGSTLQDEIFLSKGQPLAQDFIRLVFNSICSALHYAHSMGLVHCDIKPGNIMINQHGEVLLTDFGIARMTDTATATMVGFGTPAYMAPELVQGRDPTPQSDIYSLGILLYEMVTGGERPFTGERAQTTGTTSEKVRWEQVHLAAPSPRDFNPTIPSIQEAAILKCLAKAPEERFAGALDLLNDLKLPKAEAHESLVEAIVSTSIQSKAEPNNEIQRPLEGQAGRIRSNLGNGRVIAPGKGFFSQLPKILLLIAVGSVLFLILIVIGMNLLGRSRGGTPATATEPTEAAVVSVDTSLPTATDMTVPTDTETSFPKPTSTEPFKMEQLSIAMVSPSSINDFAFTQSIYDAMIALQEEYGEDIIEFVYSENMFVVDDAAAAIRDYAASGFDMVIAHGPQYGSSLQEIAPDFPDVSFAWGTTFDTFGIPNVFAYEAASDEGGFVNGVMAALMTESKVIGVVGPIETGDDKLYVDGFVAGVKATDPTIDVRVTYIGSFSDVATAAEAAERHIAAGADILTGTAQMVVGAIGKIQEAGGYWFGTQSDQASFAPDTVVASQVYHWEVILKEIIDLRAQGILGGQSFIADLANGGQVMSFNSEIDIPADVMAAAEATIADIIGGQEILLPVGWGKAANRSGMGKSSPR